MRARRLILTALLSLRELSRNRIAVLLFFLVPAVLVALVVSTSMEGAVFGFELPAVPDSSMLSAQTRDLNLIFVGIAAVGLLTSFIAMGLMQKQAEVHRRLVLCGFPALELMTAKLVTLLIVDALIASYATALVLLFFSPHDGFGLWVGFFLGGFVYGCYGLLVGVVIRTELEGVLAIALIVNIDAGWLQNPVYYANAQRVELLHSLPAYLPSQTALAASFTSLSWAQPAALAIAYGVAFMLAALVVYRLRSRVLRA
jgi:hypothetical protein